MACRGNFAWWPALEEGCRRLVVVELDGTEPAEASLGGVVEIIRPLDKDMAQTREEVVASFWLFGGVCSGLFVLSGRVESIDLFNERLAQG